jgi:uncharacterized protein YdaU (DUF1376 family)
MKAPMNSQSTQGNRGAGLAYGAAILGAFLIVTALVWAMRHYTQPEPLNANRAAERAKALAELRAAEAETLHTTAWIDQGKGIVRLRIEDALSLAEREWRDPAAARSNLMARAEKAMPAPPPPAPAQPSAFE